MSNESNRRRREEIFSEAAELSDAKVRSEFLDNACEGDDQLRSEVEALLRHDQDAGSFLQKPPEALEATFDNSAPTDECDEAWRDLLTPCHNPERVGVLGQYEILNLVGRGGMGVVLRAFDPKLSRIVAIKLLAPELSAQAMAVQRFLREARAAAAVSHDHVVSIHAIDDTAKPPMIVMEMVDGQSLQQKIDSIGALDVKSILRIGMQTAAGLSAAHRQGLVHRDIKPANILLENGIERVKLTDFGLARAIDDISMTKTGQVTGTPQYMSPEQAQGQRLDHRTDLFSLGCVLYAMCTGRAAFRADSAVAVIHQVVHDVPRPIRELNEDIPEWLCEIVYKLLAKDVTLRFDSAGDVEELLGDHLAHLQQPDAVPQPTRVAPVSERFPSQAVLGTERKRNNPPPGGPKVKPTFYISELVILLAATVILLSSLVRWHTSLDIGRFDGEQVSIGSVKLPDWRFGVTASHPPLSVWHSALAFREKTKQDWFLEIPNAFLLVAAGVLACLTVSRRFSLLSPLVVVPSILLTSVYGVLHSGMVNCAILQELEQLRVPPLLIFSGFCLAIVAVLSQLVAGGVRALNTLAVDLQLQIAGFGLLLTGIAGVVYAIANIIFFLLILGGFVARQNLPSDALQVTVIFAICIAVLVAGIVVVQGAMAVLKRTSITCAIVAGIIGQPVGLWLLWILRRHDVRDLFCRQMPTPTEQGDTPDPADDEHYSFGAVAVPIAAILAVCGMIVTAMWLSASPAPLWGLLLMAWLARIVPEDCNGYDLAGVVALICAGVSLAMMVQWTESHGNDVIVPIVVLGMLWFAADHFWKSPERSNDEDSLSQEFDWRFFRLGMGVLLPTLALISFVAVWTRNSWSLVALAVPWFVLGGCLCLTKKSGVLPALKALILIALLTSLSLVGYCVWLDRSAWPLVAGLLCFAAFLAGSGTLNVKSE